MKRSLLLIVCMAMMAGSSAAHAHGDDTVAPTPPNGLSWAILQETGMEEWQSSDGINHLAPRFTPEVEVLDGKTVTVAGYGMETEESVTVRRLTLYASFQDCMFHYSAGPTRIIDVHLTRPALVSVRPMQVTGRLHLVRERSGGVFYRMDDATVE